MATRTTPAHTRRSAELRKMLETRLYELTRDVHGRIREARADGFNERQAIDEGTYGRCVECGDEIGAARLRALPFAVRCKECEEIRELADQRERGAAQRRSFSAPLFD